MLEDGTRRQQREGASSVDEKILRFEAPSAGVYRLDSSGTCKLCCVAEFRTRFNKSGPQYGVSYVGGNTVTLYCPVVTVRATRCDSTNVNTSQISYVCTFVTVLTANTGCFLQRKGTVLCASTN